MISNKKSIFVVLILACVGISFGQHWNPPTNPPFTPIPITYIKLPASTDFSILKIMAFSDRNKIYVSNVAGGAVYIIDAGKDSGT